MSAQLRLLIQAPFVWICERVRFLAKMSILASIETILKIQYFLISWRHSYICTYIYAYHDLVESHCSLLLSPQTLIQCPIPTHLTLHDRIVQRTVYLDLGCFKDALFWQSTNCLHIVIYKKKWVCRWMSRSATQIAFGMRKSKAVQIAKIQTSLHLCYRTISITRFGVCD